MSNLKNILKTFLLLLASGYLLSCEKVDDLTVNKLAYIDTDYYEMDFSIQTTDRIGFHIFAEELFSNEINSSLEKAGLSDSKIEAVVLKEAQMSLLEPDKPADFDIMDFIELTVYTDTLGESKIAWSNPVPADQSTITLDLTEDDILPYFNENLFVITAQGYLKERVYEVMKLHARVKFQVKLNL
ncbi:hypothetical protein ACFLTU_05220 [Bacteroidota bacterium]